MSELFNNKLFLLLVSLALLSLGILTALMIDSIRYTKYVEPVMVAMEPKDVFADINSRDTGDYRFIDVRSEGEYAKIHAEFAQNIPIQNLFDLWRDLPRDKDTKIYLICTGGRLSGVAYGFLQLHGFRNIVHVTGGIQNWVAQDLPTISPSLFTE